MSQVPEPAEPGPLSSVRALGATALDLARTRLELALVELQEEGERRAAMLGLAAVAGVFLALAALLLAAFVVIALWDSHRLLAAGGVTVAYGAIGLYALLRMRRARRESPPPFEATLAELARDVEALRARDG